MAKDIIFGEDARKALQAARKAGSHRNGRR